MKIENTRLDELLLITPEIFKDNRGYFYESFNKRKFEQITKLKFDIRQDNQSYSAQGTLRGIHFQTDSYAQAKLVRVISGEIYDLAVDLRKESKNYCKWTGVYLSAEKHNQLFIPEGFGHAFLVISSHATVSYKVNNDYSPDYERCIRYDDPKLNIKWPSDNIILSSKDKRGENIQEDSIYF
jgi:dTDP-4-dehydrorhamnose 3,5-epimerase